MFIRNRCKRIIRRCHLVFVIICLLVLKSKLNIPWKAYHIPPVHVLRASPNFSSPLSPGDYRRLFNISNFHFILNHYPCSHAEDKETDFLLLFLIHSAPENWLRRQAIRDTWGLWSKTPPEGIKVHILFLMGEIPSVIVRELVKIEDRREGDIIQGSFVDAYRNLSYKHVTALKWTLYHCPRASYLVKTDDDVFVHVPKLAELLTGFGGSPGKKVQKRNLILCDRRDRAIASRSFRSRWRVSPQEYPGSYYPPYCWGCIIIYSLDVAFKIHQAAMLTPYFWIDDVLVSGILAAHVNVSQTLLSSNLFQRRIARDFISRFQNTGMFGCSRYSIWRKYFGKFIFACELDPEDLRSIWRLLFTEVKNCT